MPPIKPLLLAGTLARPALLAAACQRSRAARQPEVIVVNGDHLSAKLPVTTPNMPDSWLAQDPAKGPGRAVVARGPG
jgi:hypothetical protein